MDVAYVGDASHLRRRVRQHVTGNVEASALRRHLAGSLGLEVVRTPRPSGSTRLRLLDPDGERRLTALLVAAMWRVVVCDSAEEARAFQWYAIAHLDPHLNRDRRAWDSAADARFAALLATLVAAPPVPGAHLAQLPTAPGVYAVANVAGTVPARRSSQAPSA